MLFRENAVEHNTRPVYLAAVSLKRARARDAHARTHACVHVRMHEERAADEMSFVNFDVMALTLPRATFVFFLFPLCESRTTLIPVRQSCIYRPIVPAPPLASFNAPSREMSPVRERNSKTAESIGSGYSRACEIHGGFMQSHEAASYV